MDKINWVRKEKRFATDGISECTADNGVTYLYFPALKKTQVVKHAFSTRVGGVSTGEYSTMNFTFSKDDDRDHVLRNYELMAEAIGVSPDSFVLSYQTHTTNVRVVTKDDMGKGVYKDRDYRDVDGLITDVPGITLTTFYADCIPLYIVDPVRKAIGLSHSGWRGTLHEMGKVTVRKMEEVYGCHASDMIACVGPGICKDCYEISSDVAEEFRKNYKAGDPESILSYPHGDHEQLDLWEANRQILKSSGIKPEHIHVTDICTHDNPDYLFSHRTCGEHRGNLAGFLSLV